MACPLVMDISSVALLARKIAQFRRSGYLKPGFSDERAG